ncbi:aspartate carbamoyltransferase catalytic subunit [Legionella clemsonensis]|uniref:Aspartate carbamoyltransferase n=1 Tax=Legionella clemsonensis TaxID=1867846 RepID=A0A222P059_9GAMM|nr:aspartate carbamoyltransferase catalytic subunit [Legionella clemsonensis]ASQ45244.1 Aspartate carbamoyltransferase [Legionella clemsonensis]
MKHFLEISQLTHQEINALLERALYFKNTPHYPDYSKHTVATLFYENSTRTRVSFELAAKKLAMTVVDLNLQTSSEVKGEAIEDTVATLAAMGIDLFVIRHSQNGLQQALANRFKDKVKIINAGDGQHAHPSQALLDFMTIYEQKPQFSALKIAIVGNIRHSRVANSLQCLCSTLGVKELALVAPEIWQPQRVHFGYVTDSLPKGLDGADVIICLRVQHERLQKNEHLDLHTYRQNFALTVKTLNYAKSDVMLLHPGPINRGVEIDSDVADGPQSFILQQVINGVFIRMAILDALATKI